MPLGYLGLVTCHSELTSLGCIASTHAIDSGELHAVRILVFNPSDEPLFIKANEPIALLSILPTPEYCLYKKRSPNKIKDKGL